MLYRRSRLFGSPLSLPFYRGIDNRVYEPLNVDTSHEIRSKKHTYTCMYNRVYGHALHLHKVRVEMEMLAKRYGLLVVDAIILWRQGYWPH
jgi:hypothetical protein